MQLKLHSQIFHSSVRGHLILLILFLSVGKLCGNPIIKLVPNLALDKFENVSMYCEYNLPPDETLDRFFWYYGETTVIYRHIVSNPDIGGPEGPLEDRLTDVDVSNETHHMILNGSWCDNLPFTCWVYSSRFDRKKSENITGSRKEYSIRLNGTNDITEDGTHKTGEREGFIQVNLLWNDDVVLYVTKGSDDPVTADGIMTGSDNCTHEAIILVDYNLACGGSVSFSLEADFGNSGSRELLHDTEIIHHGLPSAPTGFHQDTSKESCNSITLQWSSACNGGSTQEFDLSWKYIDGGDKNENISDSENPISFEVTDLSEPFNYTFTLVARNELGQSSPQHLEVTIACLENYDEPDWPWWHIFLIVCACAAVLTGLVVGSIFFYKKKSNNKGKKKTNVNIPESDKKQKPRVAIDYYAKQPDGTTGSQNPQETSSPISLSLFEQQTQTVYINVDNLPVIPVKNPRSLPPLLTPVEEPNVQRTKKKKVPTATLR